ncbi:MAG: hypothetical protein HC911_13935 [Chloroflexaceae bacterium]|nr:hypothetical protein [Chloroflexaceae bacterium]
MYQTLRTILHAGRVAPTPTGTTGSARIARQRLHAVVRRAHTAPPPVPPMPRQPLPAAPDAELLRLLLSQECAPAAGEYGYAAPCRNA